MDNRVVRSDAVLLLTAAIWGLAFAAQRAGMDHVGPFLYNGIRFFLGGLVLLPLWIFGGRKRRKVTDDPERFPSPGSEKKAPTGRKAVLVAGCAAAGLLLFLGVSFQQLGIQYTSAGKAGFITGLYVILVPILGMLWKQRTSWGSWAGAVVAVAGLYLLSVRGGFHVARGDLLVMVCAVFWALHVHAIAWLSPRMSAVKLAVIQYGLCSALSLIIAAATEPILLSAILDAALPIVYGGVFSVGIAYTLQVVGQKEAEPAHAAIILSLEGVFAVVGGYVFLGEVLERRSAVGSLLMLAGMILSQIAVIRSGNRLSRRSVVPAPVPTDVEA